MFEGLMASFVNANKELLADSDIDLDTNNCDDNTELVLSSSKKCTCDFTVLKAVLEVNGKQGSGSDVTCEKCGLLDTVTLPSCLKCICMFDRNNNVNDDTVTYISNYFSSQTYRVTCFYSYSALSLCS